MLELSSLKFRTLFEFFKMCLYYTDFIINQPSTALFYSLQHLLAANYSAITREDAFLRQQAGYDTLVNG
jgi:hypothetical protein